MDQTTVTLVVGFTAVVAALLGSAIGTAVTMFVSKREQKTASDTTTAQIKAQIELSERLRWQNDFRTTVAHLDSWVGKIIMRATPPDTPLSQDEREEYAQVSFHLTRLRLMLHPSKPSERAVYSDAIELLQSVAINNWKLSTSIRQRLLQNAEQLLKLTWDETRKMIQQR